MFNPIKLRLVTLFYNQFELSTINLAFDCTLTVYNFLNYAYFNQDFDYFKHFYDKPDLQVNSPTKILKLNYPKFLISFQKILAMNEKEISIQKKGRIIKI